MQLAGFGLIAALQPCEARHAHAQAHAHIPRQEHTHGWGLSSDMDCTPEAVFTRTTTSIVFVAADVNTQYQEMYTPASTVRQGMETVMGKHRVGLQPTQVGTHDHVQAQPSQGWIENGANSTWRFGNHSAVHRPTFYYTATPFTNAYLKQPSSTASAGGAPKEHSSISSLGSHGRRRASRFAVLMIILILTGVALFNWS